MPSNSNAIIPKATLFNFGIIMSNAHIAWVHTVCEKNKSDYRVAYTDNYSKDKT